MQTLCRLAAPPTRPGSTAARPPSPRSSRRRSRKWTCGSYTPACMGKFKGQTLAKCSPTKPEEKTKIQSFLSPGTRSPCGGRRQGSPWCTAEAWRRWAWQQRVPHQHELVLLDTQVRHQLNRLQNKQRWKGKEKMVRKILSNLVSFTFLCFYIHSSNQPLGHKKVVCQPAIQWTVENKAKYRLMLQAKFLQRISQILQNSFCTLEYPHENGRSYL